jgi:hypothetical protein
LLPASLNVASCAVWKVYLMAFTAEILNSYYFKLSWGGGLREKNAVGTRNLGTISIYLKTEENQEKP